MHLLAIDLLYMINLMTLDLKYVLKNKVYQKETNLMNLKIGHIKV